MIAQMGLPLSFFEALCVKRTYRCLVGKNDKIEFRTAATIKKLLDNAAQKSEEELKKALEGRFKLAIVVDS
jgi:hypothetical protein